MGKCNFGFRFYGRTCFIKDLPDNNHSSTSLFIDDVPSTENLTIKRQSHRHDARPAR